MLFRRPHEFVKSTLSLNTIINLSTVVVAAFGVIEYNMIDAWVSLLIQFGYRTTAQFSYNLKAGEAL